MPARPAVSSNDPVRFLADLEVAYDYDLVPLGVATRLGLPATTMMRSMRITSSSGAKDTWTWTLGGQTFTREQIRTAAQAEVP